MLVNSNNLLSRAFKEGYAVPQYNINNLEWAKYILEACNEDRSPVILGVTEGATNYFGGYKVVSSMIKALIEEQNIKVPVCLHLDHASSYDSCIKAIDVGFTSVMIDASNKTFEENCNETNKVYAYASKRDVSVEAELGDLADDVIKEEEYKEFALATKINSLAPSIGNKHGFYNEDYSLNFDLLGYISKEVRIPLVLHGGSFLDDNKIKTAIFCGVSKININTELQVVWSNRIREYLNEDKEAYDPRKIIGSGKQAIKNKVHEKNALFGSKNKAF